MPASAGIVNRSDCRRSPFTTAEATTEAPMGRCANAARPSAPVGVRLGSSPDTSSSTSMPGRLPEKSPCTMRTVSEPGASAPSCSAIPAARATCALASPCGGACACGPEGAESAKARARARLKSRFIIASDR